MKLVQQSVKRGYNVHSLCMVARWHVIKIGYLSAPVLPEFVQLPRNSNEGFQCLCFKGRSEHYPSCSTRQFTVKGVAGNLKKAIDITCNSSQTKLIQISALFRPIDNSTDDASIYSVIAKLERV